MLSQLLERELDKCLRLVVAIPMDMSSFYGESTLCSPFFPVWYLEATKSRLQIESAWPPFAHRSLGMRSAGFWTGSGQTISETRDSSRSCFVDLELTKSERGDPIDRVNDLSVLFSCYRGPHRIGLSVSCYWMDDNRNTCAYPSSYLALDDVTIWDICFINDVLNQSGSMIQQLFVVGYELPWHNFTWCNLAKSALRPNISILHL